MPGKKVLVTIENRFSARYVVSTLLSQRWEPGTEFKIMHVLEAPPNLDLPQSFRDNRKRLRKGAEFLLTDIALQITNQIMGIKTSTEIREGDVKAQILRFAHKWEPDLIIMGTHDHKGLNSLLIGSVARAVAVQAPCSIMVVKDRPKADQGKVAKALESLKR
jgi:nucleotide-binding universal stress UspA family protein